MNKKPSNTLIAIEKSSGSQTLVAAGEVAELRFRDGGKSLSLRSAKLFHFLVSHAGSKACDDVEHQIRIADLNFPHVDGNELLECIRDLVGTTVELRTKLDGREKVFVDPLLYGVQKDVEIKEGHIKYRLSPTLRFILSQSVYWASLSREAVLSFESRYSLRLYEIITLRGGLKYKTSEEFDLIDFRKRLGVPAKKMMRWSNFKQSVLDKAVSEINETSNFEVSYDPIKRGRAIGAVRLSWRQREGGERAQLAQALASYSAPFDPPPAPPPPPKPKPRPFPPEGLLAYAEDKHWDALAREHVRRLPGGHVPDLGLLAQTFRAWCAYQQIRLDDPAIERKFISFCGKYTIPSFDD